MRLTTANSGDRQREYPSNVQQFGTPVLEAPEEGDLDALVEVSDDLTPQSRRSLRLSGSPPSGKLLIPLKRRDVRVVEGARLEIDSGRAC